ncbi:hypothetical protein ACFQXA_38025 [Nocardiopsis composta]
MNDRSPEEEPEEEREAEEGAGRDEEDLEEEFSKLSPEERERLARQAQELAKKLAPFREQMGRQVSKIVMESSGFARLLEEMNRRNAEILGGPAARIAKDLVGQQQAISEAIERAYRPTLGVDRLLDGAIIKPAWDQIDEEYDSEEEREERKREYVRTAFDVNAEADDTIDEQAKEAVEEFEGQPLRFANRLRKTFSGLRGKASFSSSKNRWRSNKPSLMNRVVGTWLNRKGRMRQKRRSALLKNVRTAPTGSLEAV